MKNEHQGAYIFRPRWGLSVAIQLALIVILAAALNLVSVVIAYSALIGGLVAVIPNAYFARQAFRYSGAKAAQAVTQSFYRGEAGKFITTAMLFAGAFALVKPVSAAAIFSAYVAMLLVNSLLSWWLLKR